MGKRTSFRSRGGIGYDCFIETFRLFSSFQPSPAHIYPPICLACKSFERAQRRVKILRRTSRTSICDP